MNESELSTKNDLLHPLSAYFSQESMEYVFSDGSRVDPRRISMATTFENALAMFPSIQHVLLLASPQDRHLEHLLRTHAEQKVELEDAQRRAKEGHLLELDPGNGRPVYIPQEPQP
jgi:hypothetical protein